MCFIVLASFSLAIAPSLTLHGRCFISVHIPSAIIVINEVGIIILIISATSTGVLCVALLTTG